MPGNSTSPKLSVGITALTVSAVGSKLIYLSVHRTASSNEWDPNFQNKSATWQAQASKGFPLMMKRSLTACTILR
ncbi:MAG: hypothetical protein M3015_14910 [Bacteroidota bacterium]|nr:hypothetical protein [Bacteroidota bacterium]